MDRAEKITALRERIVAHDYNVAAHERHIADLKLAGRLLVAEAAEERMRILRDTGELMRERLRVMEADEHPPEPCRPRLG